MVAFYGYQNALFGTQTTVNGAPVDYGAGPPVGATWSWSGTSTSFAVKENDGAFNFNGDGPGAFLANEEIAPQERIGGTWAQTVEIGGTERQVIWDYTFVLTAADGTLYRVAVIDVDLNNDDDVGFGNNAADPGEDGYFLVFPDGIPPADTDLTVGGIVENDAATTHAGLGAQWVCFGAGTRIETPSGPKPVEDLCVGDPVMTLDHGPQPIRWIGSRTISLSRFRTHDSLRPVRISAGALGTGLPARDMLLSRQHRMLVSSKIARRMFESADVLVSAIRLTALPGIDVDHALDRITYVHLLFDLHEIIFAEGAPSESLFTGAETLKTVTPEARQEILAIFPELAHRSGRPDPARPVPTGKRQKRLVARHRRNLKQVLECYPAEAGAPRGAGSGRADIPGQGPSLGPACGI